MKFYTEIFRKGVRQPIGAQGSYNPLYALSSNQNIVFVLINLLIMI